MSFFIDPVAFIAEWLGGLFSGLGISPEWVQVILFVIGAGMLAMGAMLFVVFLIWLERKVVGRVQDRFGPNRVGPFGLLQPIADMIKIFTKEHITPEGVDLIPYNLAPVIVVASILGLFAVIPFGATLYGSNLNVGILYIAAIGGLGEMGIVLAGYGSNNKYALLGAFRAVAQLISYEIPMVISLLIPVMFSGSMGLNDIVKAQDIWYIVLAPLAALIFLITSIAEAGRTPFDLIEAESELVAGFNIEYSGLKFGMFFVGDLLHALAISLLFATLFLGGWRGPGAEQFPLLGFVYLSIKTSIIYFLLMLLRASLPRYRIDQMMDLNWKLFTPLSLVVLLSVALAGKLLPEDGFWLRGGVLFLINMILLVATGWLLDRYTARKPRRVVVTGVPRVASPEPPETHSESGAA